ncbi:protease inhibitor 2 [Panulirus ornatus]|uniref:protease inhibitor 2 n=1 Tax=Panulirus ornatus TaxID=150431 RepID=UPI003A85BDB0
MCPACSLHTYLLIMIGVLTIGGGLQVYDGDGCLSKCVITTSYNPVCGTDYITYTNPTMLLCWKKCRDPGLGLAHFSTCVDWIIGDPKL